MAHTQTCENATNPECYCDCEGKFHGKNPHPGVTEMKEGYQNPSDNPEKDEQESEIEKAWNKADYAHRRFTIVQATGAISDRDEADFASRSSYDELSPETRAHLQRYQNTSLYALKTPLRSKDIEEFGDYSTRTRKESSFRSMIRQDRERAREQKMERRAGETFAVVQHRTTEGKESGGGYVVRTADNGILPSPYRDSKRYAEYKNKPAAQKKADNLNET